MDDKSQKSPRWLNQVEIFLLGATAIISGVVVLLDFLGVLDAIPWLSERIPTLTLLATGLVAAYLVIERRSYLETLQDNTDDRMNNLEVAIQNSTRTIIESLDGVEFKKFDSESDFLNYIIKRMSQAKKTIDDLSWNSAINLRQELNVTQKLNQQYTEQVSKISKKKQYREVFIFNRPGRIKKLQRRLAENDPGYSCAYHQTTDIPLIQFMIIDDEEMIILSDQFRYTYYSIRHPDILKLYSKYYDEVWKSAVLLKRGTSIIHDEVEKILLEYQ